MALAVLTGELQGAEELDVDAVMEAQTALSELHLQMHEVLSDDQRKKLGEMRGNARPYGGGW